jgi:hypothetical protein
LFSWIDDCEPPHIFETVHPGASGEISRLALNFHNHTSNLTCSQELTSKKLTFNRIFVISVKILVCFLHSKYDSKKAQIKKKKALSKVIIISKLKCLASWKISAKVTAKGCTVQIQCNESTMSGSNRIL